MPQDSEGRLTKLSLLMGGSSPNSELSESFSWNENDDGTWSFNNGSMLGRGHYVIAAYSGAHGDANASDHGLFLGDAVAIKNSRCWRVKAERITTHFDCWGIAMGWYEDSDGVFVQISGTIKGIGEKWIPGTRVCLPIRAYGKPQQLGSTQLQHPVGIALNNTDMLLVPRLDV